MKTGEDATVWKFGTLAEAIIASQSLLAQLIQQGDACSNVIALPVSVSEQKEEMHS